MEFHFIIIGSIYDLFPFVVNIANFNEFRETPNEIFFFKTKNNNKNRFAYFKVLKCDFDLFFLHLNLMCSTVLAYVKLLIDVQRKKNQIIKTKTKQINIAS